MFHKNRTWCVGEYTDLNQLAEMVSGDSTWTLCSAFKFHNILLLNDSISEDSLQEYAIVREEEDGSYTQIESFTVSWMNPVKFAGLIWDYHTGKEGVWCSTVHPRIQSYEQHKQDYCHLCA